MSITQRLHALQADDIRQSLQIERALHNLGMQTHIIEPESNPDFADQDIAELKRTGDFYEIVNARKRHLVVSVDLRPDGLIFARIGIYGNYDLDGDNWASMIMQIVSSRVVKISEIVNAVKHLLPLAYDINALQEKLREINTELKWMESKRRGGIAHAASDGAAQTTMKTILQQLGGNKFLAMTGAKNLVRLQTGLQFDLSSRMTTNKANRVAITLMPDDTYSISFYRLRNLDLQVIKTLANIHAAQLAKVFSRETGLDTNL